MKRKILIIFSSFFLCVLAACSSVNTAGKWRMTGIKDEESGLLLEEEMLASMGDYSMDLYEDGTGVLHLGGEDTPVTWDENGISMAGSAPLPYTIKNSTLVMIDDGASLTFIKEE